MKLLLVLLLLFASGCTITSGSNLNACLENAETEEIQRECFRYHEKLNEENED